MTILRLAPLAALMLATAGSATAQQPPAGPETTAPAQSDWRRMLPWAKPLFGAAVGEPSAASAAPLSAPPPKAATAGPAVPAAKATTAKSVDDAPPAVAATPLAASARRPLRGRRLGAGPAVPAKQLFGAQKASAALAPRAIGFYSRGCLAGARQLAVDGPAWQAMRLSRDRRWGHPILIRTIERLAAEAREKDGWPGLLVGDISQARGGPMLTGHASHQIGLDADVWLTPMPDKRLTEKEREDLAATSMLADKVSVDPKVWTPRHVALLKRAASYTDVERILVHPAIKKALCQAAGTDRAWLGRIRPYWGHHYHFHVRIGCPTDSPGCKRQDHPPADDGCGKELDDWMKLLVAPPKPPPAVPSPPKPEITLETLPKECRIVLEAAAPAAPATAPVRAAAGRK